MLNDLRVRERHAWHLNRDNHPRTGETFYRYFLGVKWSQVQILSARHRSDALSGESGRPFFDPYPNPYRNARAFVDVRR
jgi:hypothetical protein